MKPCIRLLISWGLDFSVRFLKFINIWCRFAVSSFLLSPLCSWRHLQTLPHPQNTSTQKLPFGFVNTNPKPLSSPKMHKHVILFFFLFNWQLKDWSHCAVVRLKLWREKRMLCSLNSHFSLAGKQLTKRAQKESSLLENICKYPVEYMSLF